MSVRRPRPSAALTRREALGVLGAGAGLLVAAGCRVDPTAPAAAALGDGTIVVRRGHERGHANHGWLDTRHTFSFASYRDPAHMGFRALRVINEDWIAGGAGFPMHPHRDMEILTYVLGGGLEHRDSMGNGSVIRPGEVQRMTAGTGVRHSETNASRAEEVHLLQIWLLPRAAGLTPGYEQRSFAGETRGRLRLVASPDGREGSVTIHQDVGLYAGVLAAGTPVSHALARGRHAWLQVARGAVRLNGVELAAGDGAHTSDASRLTVEAQGGEAEVLLFDLA